MRLRSGARSSRRARWLGALLMVVGVLPVGLDGGLGGRSASAELIDSFTPPAFTTNVAGAIDIVGNTLLTCGTSTNCQQTLAGTRNSGNGSFSMVDYDSDDGVLSTALANQTTNSSRAAFAPPAGSTVLYASLHWSAQSNSSQRNRISFLPPGGTSYQTVTGTLENAGSLYQASADVTSIVQAAGPGDYWAGNIRRFSGTNRYAGWSLVVVYANNGLPVRNLSVFEGFGRVTSSFRTLDVPISGFLTPPFGDVNAEIGVVAYEGDRNITGDQVRIDTNGGGTGNGLVNLSDASNPTTNFGNGSISDGGVATGEFVNNLSVDIDEFQTTNVLDNGLDNTTVRFQTQGDWWYPGVLTTAIDLFVPEFPQVTKSVVDLNGGDALPGDVLEYSVYFTNTGNDTAENSIVRDVIPDDTTFVPGSITVTNGTGSFDGTRVVAPVGNGAGTPSSGGDVDPGESAVVTFRVTVDETARGTDVENEATFAYTAATLGEDFTFTTNQTVTPVPELARLRVTKSGSPDPVAPGTDVTWTIEVTNDGPNPATGITLTDAMGANAYSSIAGATCSGATAGDTTLTCTVPDLAVGASTNVTLVSSTDPSLADGTAITNSASVSADQDDDDLGDNTAAAQVVAQPVADLSVTKRDDLDPANPGDTITYTVAVTNNGPSDAHQVRVSDQAPAAVTPTSVSLVAPASGTCDLATRSCVVSVVPLGTTIEMEVEATVRDSATGTITNTAVVSSGDADPDPSNDAAAEDTEIVPIADLTVTKSTLDAPLVAGETVQYRVRATNAGPSTAQNVVVSDVIPAGLSLVSAAPTQGTCTSTSPVSCALGSIGDGGAVDVLVTAVVGADQSGATIANTATVTTSTDQGANAGPDSATATDTVTNVSDLRIVKELQQANPVLAGTDFDFTIRVYNQGPSDTDAAYTMTDDVPAPLVVDSITGDGCPVAPTNAVVCTSATVIPAGGSAVVTISGTVPPGASVPSVDNSATVSYPTDPNAANDSTTAEVDLAAEADVRISKSWDVTSVIAGTQATVTLQVANDGPSIALDEVVVTDVLPAGMTLAGATGATCTGTTTVTCDLGQMTPGATQTITLTVDVAPDVAAGPVNNTASANASVTLDRNPDNNSDTDAITVTRSADLVVAKSSSDPTPDAGENVTYTVVVRNDGPSTGQTTFVGDALPAGLTLVGAPSASPTGTCVDNAGAVSCDLGELGVGVANEVTVTYQARLETDLDPAVPLVNTANASSPDDVDGAAGDATITVETEADLVVTKTALADPATPGGPLDFEIVVVNNGPSDARGVVIPDPLPAGYTATSVAASQGSCDTTVSCSLGTVPAGGSVVVTVQGIVDPAAGGSLTNATQDPISTTPLINTGDDIGSDTVTLEQRADLTVTKSASPTTIDAGGGVVTYSIAVSNTGPSDAQSVTVDDVLPADFVVSSVSSSQGGCAAFPCDLGTVAAGGPPATVIVTGSYPSTVTAGPRTNTASVSSPTDPGAQPGSPKTAAVDVTITESADVGVVKSGPVSVVAGETGVQYQLAVTNAGPSLASDVTVSDVLDSAFLESAGAVAVVSPAAAGSCTNNSGTIDCSFGDVAVGALITVTITVDVRSDAPEGVGNLVNTATVAASDADPNAVNDSSPTTSDVTRAADISLAKSGPTQFRAGETADYTITVTNVGPSDATGVVVDDTPAADVTFGAVTSVPGVCSSLPCNVGDLAAGDSVAITVAATVEADTNSTVVANTATATSTTADPNPANDADTINTGVIRRADMELVAKTASPDPVNAGGRLSYTISARNNGPATARDAEVNDTVPAGTSLDASTLPAGCTTTGTAPGATITCVLGLLAPGEVRTIGFEVVVDADQPTGADALSNTATASSDTIDDVAANDSATSETDVGAEADVSIAKSASGASVVPGEQLTYTLIVANAGPSVASDIEIDDDVSAIFEPGTVSTSLAGAPAGTTCDPTVNCTLADFPVGSFTIEIGGTVQAGLTADLSNTASVSTDGGTNANDPDTSDNSAVEGTSVAPNADVRVAKTASPNPALPGDPIQYTVTVFNDGPSDAYDVVVGDMLPALVTAVAPTPLTVTDDPAGGATCDQGALTCTFTSIPAGDSAEFTLDADVSTRAVGTIANTASVVSSATPDDTPGNDSVTISTPVVPEADLQIVKTALTDPVVAGRPIRYNIAVTNDGPAVAENVSIVDVLPADATFVNAATPVGSCAGVNPGDAGGTLTCDLGDLGDQTVIVIVVNLQVAADANGTIDNTATGTTTTDDPIAGNNDGTNPNGAVSDPIVIAPDLRVRKVLTDPNLVAGDTFEYVITITNDGPSVAQADVVLSDALPPEIDLASATNPLTATFATTPGITPSTNNECTLAGAQLDCTFDSDVPVGERITVTVTGAIEPTATSVADNTATVTTADNDPVTANNSGTAEADLIQNADLRVTKTFADSDVLAGNSTVVTISVTNDGPSTAVDAELVDVLPAGLTVASVGAPTTGSCSNTATTVTCTAATLDPDATMTVAVVATVDPTQPSGPITNEATASSGTDDRNPSNNADVDDIQVDRLAGLTLTKTAASTTVLAGNQLTYTLVVTNSGPSSAEATVLGDTLPAGVLIDTGTLDPRCTAPGNVLTCDLGELGPVAPSNSATVAYTVTFDPAIVAGTAITNNAQADSSTPLVAPATSDETVTVGTSADVELVAKTVTPDPVIAGETVSYTITVRNNGPSLARNTTITDVLPPSLTPVNGSFPAECPATATQTVTCDVGDLAVDATATVTFDATVDPAAPTEAPGDTITNAASVASDEPDPDSTNDTGSAVVNVDGEAELLVTKSAAPDPAVPGEPITYTVVVTNNGPSRANDVVVSDAVPAGLTGATAVASDGSTCDATVSCPLGSLDAGASVTITIDASVASGVTTSIENTATVTSSTPPTVGSPPRDVTITTPVAPQADLAITKTLDTDPPVPGTPVQYTITVTNPGPSDAQSVAIADTISGAVTNLAADQGVCAFSGQDLSCAVGTLAPGAFSVVVTGDLDEGFTGSLANSATVTTTTDQGANASPDTATVNQVAAPEADLVLTKVATPDPVVAGEVVTYTIEVTNNGPSSAVGVQVDDALPAGLDLIDVTSSQNGCTEVPCDLGDLVAGASASVTINAQVESDVTDLPPNNASTTAATPDPDTGNNTASADPAVTTSADLVTTKVLDTSPAVPGTRLRWTIDVGNNGPSDAADVVVADTVPAVLTDVTVSSSQGGCLSFPCGLGAVAPGGSATITVEGDLPADTPAGTIDNAALTTSATPDPVPGDDNPTASDPITPSADVAIAKVGPSSDLVPGRAATFTVTVSNAGPSDAQAVTFTDSVPAAIDPATIATTVVSGAPSCDPPAGSVVTCTQAAVPPGSAYVVEISGTVLADVVDPSVANTADVTTTTPDPNPVNDTATSSTPVVPEADLSIAKALTAGFGPVIDPGAPVSYTITVTNDGPSDAQNVVVADVLPAEITLGAISTAAAGATCDQGAVTCTIPTVAALAGVDVVVTGTMSDRAVGSVDNTATVTSDTPDPDPGDGSVTVATPVTPFADVQIAKSLLTGPLTAGTNDRYRIVVTNDGPATAVGVRVVDALPDGVVFVSVSSPIGACVHDGATTGGDVTCDLGDLSDQASVIITIDVSVEPDTSGALTNLATATNSTIDPTPGNNDAGNPAGSTTDAVVVAPDLQATKRLVESQLTAGAGFTYEIAVKNNGPSDALADIVVTDTLPAQVDQAEPIVATFSVDGGLPALCPPATLGGTNATVTCTVPDDLPVGDEIVVTIVGEIQSGVTTFDDNTVVVTTADADPNPANDISSASGDLVTNADLVLTKSFAAPATVRAGETIPFALLVENRGPSDAVAVQLVDILPAGFTIEAAADIAAPPTAGCTIVSTGAPDNTLDCDLGTIVAGTSQTVTVVATVDPMLPAGPVTNTASVSSSTPDRNPDSNTATDQVAVTRFADLDLAKTVVSPTPPASVLAGETISYQVVFTNNGPSSAEGSVVGDPLADGVTIVPASVLVDGAAPAAPRSCDTTGNLLTCELGEVSPVAGSNSVTITYDVVVESGVTTGPIENTATANSPTPNDNPSSNTSTGVATESDLELVSKTSNPTSVDAGETLEYTITIRNNGPSVSRDVEIADDIPAGVTVVAATLPSDCATVAGGDVQCALGDVDPGEVVVRAFSATVSPAQLGDVVNSATVSSPTTPEPVGGGASNTETAVTTVTTSADLVTTKSASPSPAVPGEPVTYTITVVNDGPSVARLVEITDADAVTLLTGSVTAGWTNGASSGTCDATITCAIGDLGADATATVTITGTVPSDRLTALVNTAEALSTGPDATPDPTPGDAVVTASTPVAPAADIGVAKTIDTVPLVPGQPVQFTITVTNSGPSDARNVRVNDLVDAAVTDLATTNGACGIAGRVLACTIPVIEPGAVNAVEIVLTGDLDPSFTGDLANTVTVAADTAQGVDTAPNSATATRAAAPQADLELAKSASPDPVVAGENVTYEMTVTNNGPSDALGVAVADVLPAGLTLVNVSSSQGACAALPCLLNTIPDGGSATVTVVATVDPDRLDIDANSAAVSSSTPDPTPGNNGAAADPAITTLADVSVTKTLSTATAVPGSAVRWTITVANAGPSDALDVEVTDSLPSEVDAVVIGSDPAGCAAFPCVIDSVPAGGDVTITVDATLPADIAPGDLDNTVSAVGSTPDPDAGDNVATASNPIVPAADLRITKTGPADDVVAGTAVSWTLTVVNEGPSDAQDVVVTDALPAALDPATIVVDDGGATCSIVGSALSCTVATLGDGDSLTVTVDGRLRTDVTAPSVGNAASVSSSTADPDTSNNSDTTTNVNAPLADVVVTGTATPTEVAAGTSVDFEFVIVNDGPSDAADTVVTIPVPASVTLSGTPVVVGFPGATVTVVGGVITVDLGDLPPDTPVTIRFTGDVSADQPPGPLSVTATVSTTTDQDVTANDADTVTLDVVSDVDLSIEKTADLATVRFGDTVTYTITVANAGSTNARDATLVDDLPAGLTVVSAAVDGGAACDVSSDDRTVTCGPLDVPAADQVVVTIVAEAIGDGIQSNVASVECDCIVATISSDPATVEIDRRADLGVTKTVFRQTTSPGFAVTYTITVVNDGPDTAVGTVVDERLPRELNFVRATASVGRYDEATGTWTVGDLADGATATLEIRAVVLVEGTFTNEVTVRSAIDDDDTSNNRASAVVMSISPDLPRTGSSGSPTIIPISIGVLLAGAALLVGSRVRRRRGDTLART